MMAKLLFLIRNRSFIIYGAFFIILLSITGYHKYIVNKLENKILQIENKLKEKELYIYSCNTNIDKLKGNLIIKDNAIKQLQKEINIQKDTCAKLIKSKEQLISKLQKVKNEKPRDIKPTIIYKEKCSFKIETKENLNEEDTIFNVLNTIGK